VQRAECRTQSGAARQTNRWALCLSLTAGILLWSSFPPLNLWPLAWIAPVPWLCLVRIPGRFTWRTYAWIYLGGFVHWLAMLQGIRLAHPALVFGWITLAWYLAFYTPILVWLCRVATCRLRLPLVIAAPVVWVGLELIRAHFVTGFSAGQLGHTQIAWRSLLQISDLFGASGVSFVLAIVSAAIAQMLPAAWLASSGKNAQRWSLWPAIPAVTCLAATLAYGYYRMGEVPPRANEVPLRVALIQGSLDTVFDTDEAEYRQRVDRTFRHYTDLTREALAASADLDLVIWPESMFPRVEFRIVEPLQVPPELALTASELREGVRERRAPFESAVQGAAALLDGPAFLFGTNTVEYGPHAPKQYNAALLADRHGEIVARYYKVHPVMFGEYIPFGEWFPWIYDLTPLPRGLDRGPGPTAMPVAGKSLSPCICFENVVPHLVRSQVLQLTRRGTPPDILVTVTNDGWFYGSSILDLHFRCAVFRAIENRRPMLIAANTGISAHIDANGRIVAVGPRRAPQVLLIDARADGRRPIYHTMGDWPAIVCAGLCGVLVAAGLWPGKSKLPIQAAE
jgi:apolipoprotein N-acyltransferase